MSNLKSLVELISLKGEKVLITGCAAGIGRAMALRFAEAGATLELVDMDERGLINLKKELLRNGAKVNVHKVDLSKKEEMDELWKKLEGCEPDILVNNAGIYPFKKFTEIDEDFLGKVMDINLQSVFWMCQEMIKRRGKNGGVIINVGSIEAILPFGKDLVPYGVSKAGVIALTRALAKEYGKKGFKINAIVPGSIRTPGTNKTAKEILKFKFSLLKLALEFKLRLPLGRFGEPDEVARMAVVLASDLSSYMHGSLIIVDGGFLSA